MSDYNDKISQVPGIFGDFPAINFQTSDANPVGAPNIDNPDPTNQYASENLDNDEDIQEEVIKEDIEDVSNDEGDTSDKEFGEDVGPAHEAITSDSITDATATTEIAGFTTNVEPVEVKTEEADEEDVENTEVIEEHTTEGADENRRKAKDIIADIEKAETSEEVDQIIGDDERTTVVNAAKARKRALEK